MLTLSRLLTLGGLMLVCAGCSQQAAQSPSAGTDAAADSAERGAALYAQNCVPCHRENGEGVPKVFPSLSGSPAVTGDPIELAQWVLSQKRPASIPAGRYPTQMLLFGWMSDPDAAALVTYIRSHFGNSAAPVDAAMIAKAREK
jgi:mono/diheme cytochrome c family protein